MLAWFKYNTVQVNSLHGLFCYSKGASTDADRFSVCLVIFSSRLDIQIFHGASVYSLSGPDVSASLKDTNWHSVTVTYDPVTQVAELWIDGISIVKGKPFNIPATSVVGTTIPQGGKVSLGFLLEHTVGAPTGYYYTGDIDEARVYSRVLSKAEIRYFHLFPGGANTQIITGNRIAANTIKARNIDSGEVNTLIQRVANYLAIGDRQGAHGWIAADTNFRSYLDRDEVRLEKWASSAWRKQGVLQQDAAGAFLEVLKMSGASPQDNAILRGDNLTIQDYTSSNGNFRMIMANNKIELWRNNGTGWKIQIRIDYDTQYNGGEIDIFDSAGNQVMALDKNGVNITNNGVFRWFDGKQNKKKVR